MQTTHSRIILIIIIIFADGVTQRQIFDKTIQVNQLNVVEAHGILLLRAEKGLYKNYLFENTTCLNQKIIFKHNFSSIPSILHFILYFFFQYKCNLDYSYFYLSIYEFSFLLLSTCPYYVRSIPLIFPVLLLLLNFILYVYSNLIKLEQTIIHLNIFVSSNFICIASIIFNV